MSPTELTTDPPAHSSTTDVSSLVSHTQESIRLAESLRSSLPAEILRIPGYSSDKVRHFLNNLCAMDACRYLEVGVWQGATFVSALHGNTGIERAVAIDDFSQFGGPRDEFHHHCRSHLRDARYHFVDANCFQVDPHSLGGPFNVFFYDGEHSRDSQERAFTHFDSALADPFVAVVDDWNAPEARDGTRAAFDFLQYDAVHQTALPAIKNGDRRNWWNGLFVAVVRKTSAPLDAPHP